MRTLPLVALALAALALAPAAPAQPAADPAVAPPACPELSAIGLVPQPEVSPAPCPGIRPGAATTLRLGPEWWFPLQAELVLCTMAFIVTDGADLYVTLAGHCVVDGEGKVVPGTRAEAAGIGQFGTVVYAWCEGRVSNAPCSLGRDFGMIKVDADKRHLVNPAMCAWGAPTGGLFTEPARTFDGEDAAIVQHFGWGTGVAAPTAGVTQLNGIPLHVQPANPATQAREGLLVTTNATTATLLSPAAPGDSGSGAMVLVADDALGLATAQPQALGVLTHIGGSFTYAQRLDASLARAGADMGKTFTLVTQL